MQGSGPWRLGRDYVAVYAGKSLLGDPVVYQNCIEPETRVLGCLSSGSFIALAVQTPTKRPHLYST